MVTPNLQCFAVGGASMGAAFLLLGVRLFWRSVTEGYDFLVLKIEVFVMLTEQTLNHVTGF